MSSTILVSRAVAALQTLKGVYYALFEQTYSSNDRPKTPRWHCAYFGTAEACMHRLVIDAAATEGGILKEASGPVSPRTYLANWRTAFKSPGTLKKHVVHAQFGIGFYDIGDRFRSSVAESFANHGIVQHGDSVVVSLYENPDLFQELLDKKGIAIWKFLAGSDYSAAPQDELAYAPALTESIYSAIPAVVVRLDEKVGERHYWIRDEDGKMLHSGWAYSTIETMIRRYAVASESNRPGSAEDTIRLIRTQVQNAAMVADESPVIIERDLATCSWQVDGYQALADLLGVTGKVISTTVSELRAVDAHCSLKGVPTEMIRLPDLMVAGMQGNLLAA